MCLNLEISMQETENQERRDDLFSKVVRAGKRTYFFDVKATRANQQYLTITESNRRFDEELGKFFYKKHKVFLYGEDFEKFKDGLNTAISFIENAENNTTQCNILCKNVPRNISVLFSCSCECECLEFKS